jgi:CheY-like chemotaxis protein
MSERRNILVADDEPSDVTLIADAMTRRGYTVITAGNGKEQCEHTLGIVRRLTCS